MNKLFKPEAIQIAIALLVINLFIGVLLGFALIRDPAAEFLCNSTGGSNRICAATGPPTPVAAVSMVSVSATITSACVDSDGLKFSVGFEQPLTGMATVQIYSTGPDFFHSPQGPTDSYEIATEISSATDRLDLSIPVVSVIAGEQIFGNVFVTGENISSQLSYFIQVADCLPASAIALTPTSLVSPDGFPALYGATCLESKQLMISFEFERPVLGQYQALVADIPYQLASVANQPATLFFFGAPPPQGPIVIKLISVPEQVIVFEETYTPPVCGSRENPPDNSGGDTSPQPSDPGGGDDDDGNDDDGDDGGDD